LSSTDRESRIPSHAACTWYVPGVKTAKQEPAVGLDVHLDTERPFDHAASLDIPRQATLRVAFRGGGNIVRKSFGFFGSIRDPLSNLAVNDKFHVGVTQDRP
jgi:hypothetical protein